MPHPRLHLILAATAVVLASCSDPARPAVPAPEVPVRPAPPAVPPAPVPPSTSAPAAVAPEAGPPVAAARLPAPAADAAPVLPPAAAAAPAPTPQDQGPGEADTAITTALRKAIQERRELSAEAHAVMVTTRDRVVTLRGAVADEPERDAMLSLVHALPDVQRVDDQLEPVVR